MPHFLGNVTMDLKFRLLLIDHYCTFRYLLSYRDSEHIELNPDDYMPNCSVFCPFHENTDTKAAKLYPPDSNTSSEKLYCFAENQLYYPHNLLTPDNTFTSHNTENSKFKGIVPYTPSHVYNMIWSHLPDEDKQYWATVNPDIQINKVSYDKEFNMYKKGDIDLFSLLNLIIQKSAKL